MNNDNLGQLRIELIEITIINNDLARAGVIDYLLNQSIPKACIVPINNNTLIVVGDKQHLTHIGVSFPPFYNNKLNIVVDDYFW